MVLAATTASVHSPICIISCTNYSSYSKLLSVTMKVLEACARFRGKNVDLDDIKRAAFSYLIKIMQRDCFHEELLFLSNLPTNYKKVPKRIKNLNFFKDSQGLLRSKRGVGRNVLLSYDRVNPI